MKRDMDTLKAVLKADYDRHIKKFTSQHKENIDLLLIGDSLVAYYPVEEKFLGLAINQGIPGDTTLGVLKRLHIAVKHQPKTIVCHIGTNDFVLTEDDEYQINARIHLIYESLKPARVIIVSPTPVNDDLLKKAQLKRNNKDLYKLNEVLKQTIPQNDYLDIYALLEKNQMLNPNYTNDGIHLNKEGYLVYHHALKGKL